MVQNRKKSQQKRPSNHLLSHELGSEWVSAAERVSEASSAWAKWAVQSELCEASGVKQVVRMREQCEQTDKQTEVRVAQYFSLKSWLF